MFCPGTIFSSVFSFHSCNCAAEDWSKVTQQPRKEASPIQVWEAAGVSPVGLPWPHPSKHLLIYGETEICTANILKSGHSKALLAEVGK